MAQEKKVGFPTIPSANWFQLRERLKQKLPNEVSPSYIATALGMSERSAGANVLPALKSLGIISEDGKLSELAYEWRDDSKYQEVCQKIIEATYPQELTDLFHNANNVDQDNLRSWFMRTSKVGEAAAIKYARTYFMLLRGEIEQNKDSTNAQLAIKPKKAATNKVSTSIGGKKEKVTEVIKDVQETGSSFSPNLHIDIQIHISPDSTAEQIDKIFESMSKHLKGFKS